MATNVPKLTYSVPEVCEALQISRTTLWKLVRSRRLKPVRIGRRVLFSLKAVDEFLNGDSSSAHRSRLDVGQRRDEVLVTGSEGRRGGSAPRCRGDALPSPIRPERRADQPAFAIATTLCTWWGMPSSRFGQNSLLNASADASAISASTA